jgi:hypothetical protein
MIDEIITPEVQIYEFDLTEINLPEHELLIDEEGIYILNNQFRFFITNEFLKDGISLTEESNLSPPIILTQEQKEAILFSIKEIVGLYKD